MFVTYRGSLLGLLGWQWKSLVFYAVGASAVVVLDRLFALTWFEIGTLPLAVLGGAIGIFVSFRTNSGYDRWWEGRRLWGQLVNTSRHFATQVLTYVDGAREDTAHALVRRHVAYVHVLRCVLRGQDPWKDADVVRVLGADEIESLRKESNANHALLHRQTEDVVALARAGAIDVYRLQLVDRSIATLLDVQGGCERIKRTPFPPGYGFVAMRLIQIFSIMLPLGLADTLGWVAVPVSVLLCMGFTLISEVGRVLEDPFTLFWPALPLQALSTTIEVNLRQRLGDRDLPAIPQADANGILM